VIDDFSVEGVIVHTYRSCARVQMSLPHIMRRLRDRGILSLAIETQGDPHEEEQARARIEPFIEMLLDKRRNET
jgi:benzoyl-CoA reductase/2-hydroxyglutaryl-CoA dehydratase subunit BcrC/BadD/HgdB